VTPVSAIEGHRLWAPSYDAGPNPLLRVESRAMAALLGPVAGLSVVDVACGTGRWAERLSRLGARVTGIDACGQMLVRAAEKRSVAGRLVLADAGALPLRSDTADLTICSFALGYFARLRHAFAEMARITNPGGTVATSDFHPAAVAAGWTRSFQAAGTVYRIEHFTRTSDQICLAARHAGLEMEFETDQYFGEPERAIFVAAGKGDTFEAFSRIPAVWIGIWKKP
jgi:SAM-dependent methyltransferase